MESRKVTLKIYRFNPEKDKEGYFQEFTVEAVKGMTLLEALFVVKDNFDPTLSFRAYCRSAICGSCAVRVNGHPKLACKTQVLNEIQRFQTDTLTIEPIENQPVIKDLIVDWNPAIEKMKELNPYLIPDKNVVPESTDEESRVSPEQLHEFDSFTDCILCTACYSVCTAATVDENYAGPFELGKLFRFAADPRDALKEERSKIGYAYDMWSCVRCERCADVCPKGVSPVTGVMKLRGMSMSVGLRNNPGARHVYAFYKSLMDSGLLNEVLLPIRTKGIKAVFEQLPLGIKLILKGKVHSPIQKPIEEHESLVKIMKASLEVR